MCNKKKYVSIKIKENDGFLKRIFLSSKVNISFVNVNLISLKQRIEFCCTFLVGIFDLFKYSNLIWI